MSSSIRAASPTRPGARRLGHRRSTLSAILPVPWAEQPLVVHLINSKSALVPLNLLCLQLLEPTCIVVHQGASVTQPISGYTQKKFSTTGGAPLCWAIAAQPGAGTQPDQHVDVTVPDSTRGQAVHQCWGAARRKRRTRS